MSKSLTRAGLLMGFTCRGRESSLKEEKEEVEKPVKKTITSSTDIRSKLLFFISKYIKKEQELNL